MKNDDDLFSINTVWKIIWIGFWFAAGIKLNGSFYRIMDALFAMIFK